ncbi:MAG: hypothetical protein QOE83_941 [Actinomycetota bacterium]|jgi:RNA polymerase sigma factor (sigma-70 family)|nr:hypothetical protein [Actinomycetota bacterium]
MNTNLPTEPSLEQILEAELPSLVRFCILLSGDRSSGEELAQEAVAQSLLRLESGQVRNGPAYLRRAAVNTWTNAIRRRRLETSLRHLQVTNQEVEELEFESRDSVWRALSHVPPRQRAALVLRFYEDLSVSDIAEVLQCSDGTVKSNIHRGMKRLAKELGDE